MRFIGIQFLLPGPPPPPPTGSPLGSMLLKSEFNLIPCTWSVGTSKDTFEAIETVAMVEAESVRSNMKSIIPFKNITSVSIFDENYLKKVEQ